MALLGIIVFVLANVVTGSQLLGLARRTGRRPERLLGSSLLAMGLCMPLLLVCLMATGLPTDLRAALGVTSFALSLLGLILAACFIQQVFRPKAPWARALPVLAFLLCGGPAVGALVSVGDWQQPFLERGAPTNWSTLGYLLVFSWGALEAFSQARLLRKRERLGLVDPVVTVRMQLWGSANLCQLTSSLLSFVPSWALGRDFTELPWALSVLGLLSVATGSAYLLAFRMPNALKNHLGRNRVASPGGFDG